MENLLNNLIIFGAKYLLVVIVIIAFWYFIKQSQSNKKQIIIFALFVFPLAYLASRIMACFYYDPRPFVDGNIIPLFPHKPDNGFPSDHALLSAAIAAVIFYFNRKIGWLLLILAVLVGAARVLAGVHHWIDIAGSIIIALLISFLAYKFLLPITPRFMKK